MVSIVSSEVELELLGSQHPGSPDSPGPDDVCPSASATPDKADPQPATKKAAVSKSKKRIKPQAAEDETKAKKPKSAYNVYVSQQMAKIKAEQPEIPHKDRMAIIGLSWKGLSEKEKLAFKPAQA
jgi:hypothetical protein